jgi:hypothetical protein
MQNIRQSNMSKTLIRRHPGQFSSPDHNIPSHTTTTTMTLNSPMFAHSSVPRNAQVNSLHPQARIEYVEEDKGRFEMLGGDHSRGSTPGVAEEPLHPNDHRNFTGMGKAVQLARQPQTNIQQVRPQQITYQQARPQQPGGFNNQTRPAQNTYPVQHNPQLQRNIPPPSARPPSAASNTGTQANYQRQPLQAPNRFPQGFNANNPQPHLTRPINVTPQPQGGRPAQIPTPHNAHRGPTPVERYERKTTETSENEGEQLPEAAFSFAKADHTRPQPFQPQKDNHLRGTTAIPPSFWTEKDANKVVNRTQNDGQTNVSRGNINSAVMNMVSIRFRLYLTAHSHRILALRPRPMRLSLRIEVDLHKLVIDQIRYNLVSICTAKLSTTLLEKLCRMVTSKKVDHFKVDRLRTSSEVQALPRTLSSGPPHLDKEI